MKTFFFLWLFLAGWLFFSPHTPAQAQVIDDFESLHTWRVIESDGVELGVSLAPGQSGQAFRLDFHFVAGAGYCGIQITYPVVLPENYRFTFAIRGEGPANNLEFKLLDAGGDNVWWNIRRNYSFPDAWSRIIIKKRHLGFAWGPTTDQTLRQFDKIEFMISSASGGRGSVYLDDFRFEPLPPASDALPVPQITASSAASQVMHLSDGDESTLWKSAPESEAQQITLDYGQPVELGGLVIDWDARDYAQRYRVLGSMDGKSWETLYSVNSGKPGRAWLYIPEADARCLRLELQESSRRQGYAIAEIALKNISFSATPEAFYTAIAADRPRGSFPRYWSQQQSYWTVVGANNDTREALINTDGMVEVDKSQFSIEPMIYCREQLFTWHDAHTTQALQQGHLPLARVQWRSLPVDLDIEAFAAGPAGASWLALAYTVTNPGATAQKVDFYLAIRPFQVNPPWQFLNWPGGTARIDDIAYASPVASVNDARHLHFMPAPQAFGAAVFDEGDIADFIRDNRLPAAQSVHDAIGFASAAARYALELAPGASQTIRLLVPFHQAAIPLLPADALAFNRTREQTAAFWREKIDTFDIRVPAMAQDIIETVRANLAWVLINRDGPGIQPGSRSYERSWIRDGALTSATLLRFGIRDEVKEYLTWYSQFVYPNGKVPCVVDHRGADPVPENDSNGEYLFAMLQYFRFTADSAFLRTHYPVIRRAAAWLDTLVSQRTVPRFLNSGSDSLDAFYGLVPESISHEGYSAKPMHSYWDNFFTLRGYHDAVEIARILGQREDENWLTRSRDTFEKNLYASLQRAMRYKKIDYIPGCVELGDFDATSTAIAIYPGNQWQHLPQPQGQNTFDRYYEFFEKRRDGRVEWRDYTPYETRLIGAFVRIGQPERAHALLDFFMADRRPEGWRHWAEVVWRHPETPRFIGDMPHTWVGSDFIHSIRTLFLYEDEARETLVLGAGLRPQWLEDAQGVSVTAMPTCYGAIDYIYRKKTKGTVIEVGGAVRVPKGGVVVHLPAGKEVRVNGKKHRLENNRQITLHTLPATIEIK